MGNCPSRWTDLASVIQVNWTAPERPNGIVLQYYLRLTNYDGTSVIATESVGSSDVIGQLDSSELRECQDNCDFYFNMANVALLHPSPPTPTEDGVPYIVSIFAENSAGNGTKCNVTDFTNELRKFHCCTK